MEGQNMLPHVVIVGAGFGGLRAALSLSGKPVQVTLVDRNNYHLFQPLLYQVATSTLSPDEIAYPVRVTLRRGRNLAFHLGAVKEIDIHQKRLVTDNGDLAYDYLVLAVGGETNYFGNETVAQNSFGLKSLDEATNIRNHILQQFEKAINEPDPEKRRAMLTFVVVGGGPTGVECSGAISELIRTVLHKDYPTLDINDISVILLEAADRLMAAMPQDLSEHTYRVLKAKQVDVRLQCAVASYDGQTVQLSDGSVIHSQTLIWAAGVRAASLLKQLGVELDRGGRVKVAKTLDVPGYPEVFVIGDAAAVEGPDGKPLPMLAPVAMQQASLVAKNILNRISGSPLEPFEFHDPGTMATIGRNQAIAIIGRWHFRGFIAWLLWLGVHIIQLIGFRNRLAVLLDWAWSYIFYERAARLISPN
jgi:NADH dehydrogenase